MTSLPPRPPAESQADRERQEMADKKLLMLEGDWSGLVDSALLLFFDKSVVARIESARDISRNPYKYANLSINTVFETAPTTAINTPRAEGEEPPDQSEIVNESLWALRDTAQLYTNALGDSFLRMDWRNGEICYRVVQPNVVERACDPKDPGKIVWFRETLISWLNGEQVWTRETYDLRDPEKPKFAVHQWIPAEGDKTGQWGLATAAFAKDLPESGYPFWDEQKRPIMPYVHCPSKIGGRTWQEHGWVEILACTLLAACFQTFWAAGLRDVAYGKAYIIDGTLPSAASQREGTTPPDQILMEAGTILAVVSTHMERSAQIGTIPSTFSVSETRKAINDYITDALRDAGLGPVDEAPAKGVSGAAITISREALRRSQRRQIPACRRADKLILATAARFANAYSTKPGRTVLPEDPKVWEIRYNGIPPSVEEMTANTQKAAVLKNSGLVPAWMAVAAIFPELTEEQCRAVAAEAKAENAPATPEPTQDGTENAPAPETQPALVLTPSDLATIVTVNEGRASAGLPPMPGPDGDLTISEFKAKYSAVVAEAANAEGGDAGGKPPPKQPDQATEPPGES